MFPIKRVLDLKKLGDIGGVNHRHFSFMGHPIAFPGQTLRQLKVLRLLLKFLEELDAPGAVVKMDPSNQLQGSGKLRG